MMAAAVLKLIAHRAIFSGLKLQSESHCHGQRGKGHYSSEGLHDFRNLGLEQREQADRGWMRKGRRAQGLHLTPRKGPRRPSPITPCISSRAHRLEGQRVFTHHPDTLITARSAVSSSPVIAQTPSPSSVLRQLQVCPPSGCLLRAPGVFPKW